MERHAAKLLVVLTLGLPITAWASDVDPVALERLAQEAGADARVSAHPLTGGVRFLQVPSGRVALLGEEPVQRATDFLSRHGGAFGIRNLKEQLSAPRVTTDRYGHTHVAFRQLHRGLPVFGGELRVHLDADGRLIAANGTFLPGVDVDVAPRIRVPAATESAIRDVESGLKAAPVGRLHSRNQRLIVYRPGLAQR